MKIAIPTNDGEKVADHFGRCASYICFDGDGKKTEPIKNTSEHMGGKGLPPELLKKNGVDVLLCKDLGPNAVRLCKESNIKVFKHFQTDDAMDLFNLWKSGDLKEATLNDSCENRK